MNRQGVLVGFLAGGWLATVLLVLLPHVGILSAQAEDPPGSQNLPYGPGGSPGVGPTVNPSSGGSQGRGVVNPGAGMADSNQRAIAIAASIGSGQNVVYYFDTVKGRLCVYQYTGGARGGLRLLAARLIDYDLKLEQYRDLSEKTPREMREAWEASTAPEGSSSRRSAHPTKSVEVPGGIR